MFNKIVTFTKLNADKGTRKNINSWIKMIRKEIQKDFPNVTVVPFDSKRDYTNEYVLFLVLGGDGTMLYAMKQGAKHSAPVVGINCGNLGFLTEYTGYAELHRLILHIKTQLSTSTEDDDSPVTYFPRHILETCYKGGEQAELAANEVHIAHKNSGMMMEFEVIVQGQSVGVQKGDGVLISTPIGSTAYSMSAGGAIMLPIVEANQITVVSPHMLTSRPLIIPKDRVIEVKVLNFPVENISVRVDGQEFEEPVKSNTIQVRSYRKEVWCMRRKDVSYYEILAKKLLWWQKGN